MVLFKYKVMLYPCHYLQMKEDWFTLEMIIAFKQKWKQKISGEDVLEEIFLDKSSSQVNGVKM